MSEDEIPQQVLRAHPEFAKLVELCRGNPEAQAVLAEFLRSCQGVSREQLADVFAQAAIALERMIN